MNNDNLYSRIANLIQYIEDNIENNLTLEALSEICYISKYHLIRVFKSITDMTIIDYVRRRKLARSLEDLLNTNSKIVDIAVKYGFNYEQSYIRAFKEEYDTSPCKYRNSPSQLKIIEKINIDLYMDYKNGLLAKPIFVVRPEIRVIGVKDIIRIEEKYIKNLANSRGVSFYFDESHKIKNVLNPNVYIGLTKVVGNDAEYTYYMPCLEVSNFEEIPEGMCFETIPASKYIVFRYIGTHSPVEISLRSMKDLYDYIFQTWVYKNKYDFMLNGGFRFEEIDGRIASESYCEAKIYFPIKEI